MLAYIAAIYGSVPKMQGLRKSPVLYDSILYVCPKHAMFDVPAICIRLGLLTQEVQGFGNARDFKDDGIEGSKKGIKYIFHNKIGAINIIIISW